MWTTVEYAPQALLGIDAVAVGHLLNAIAGTTVLAITGVMGWRIRPAAGVVAVFAMLGFAYLMDLTRTTRLDVPAAALALLYLELGWRAVHANRRRWAIGAGAVFALAVLVKEVAIPLAPVPFLFAIILAVPWRRILRQASWTALFAALGLAPWFAYYAANTGRVYRLVTGLVARTRGRCSPRRRRWWPDCRAAGASPTSRAASFASAIDCRPESAPMAAPSSAGA